MAPAQHSGERWTVSSSLLAERVAPIGGTDNITSIVHSTLIFAYDIVQCKCDGVVNHLTAILYALFRSQPREGWTHIVCMCVGRTLMQYYVIICCPNGSHYSTILNYEWTATALNSKFTLPPHWHLYWWHQAIMTDYILVDCGSTRWRKKLRLRC